MHAPFPNFQTDSLRTEPGPARRFDTGGGIRYNRFDMTLQAFLIGVGLWAGSAGLAAGQPSDPAVLLPRAIGGWTASGPDRVFTPETLAKYDGGIGRLALDYDVRSLVVRDYAAPGLPALRAELYETGSAADAFGLHSHDAAGEPVPVGQDGIYSGGRLRFWKDRFYARVSVAAEIYEAKAVLQGLGLRIAAAVPREGRRPRLPDALPGPGLDKSEIRWFRRQSTLAAYYYIADEDLLGLSDRTEAVLATYRTGADAFLLLLARYPSGSEADRIFRGLGDSFFFEKIAPGADRHIEEIEPRSFTAALRRGATLALVLDAPTREAAWSLLLEADKQLRR